MKFYTFLDRIIIKWSLPWLRNLVTKFFLLRSVCERGEIHMKFVADRVIFRHTFLRILTFSPVSIILPVPRTHRHLYVFLPGIVARNEGSSKKANFLSEMKNN